VSSYWWIDRCAPGVVASFIVAAAVWVSHRLLKRHITRVADDQTATLSVNRDKEGGNS